MNKSDLIDIVNYLLIEKKLEAAYIGAIGDINYNIETDVIDYLVFIKPTAKEIFYSQQHIECITFKNYRLHIRDFRFILEGLGSMSLEYLEAFSTKHYWINSYYVQHFNWIRDLIKPLLQDQFLQFTKRCWEKISYAYFSMEKSEVWLDKKLLFKAAYTYYFYEIAEGKHCIELAIGGKNGKVLNDILNTDYSAQEAQELITYYKNIMQKEYEIVKKDCNYIEEKSINHLENYLFDLFSLMY